MNIYTEPTNYRIAKPHELLNYVHPVGTIGPGETIPGYVSESYLPLPSDSNVLSSAWNLTYSLEQAPVRSQAIALLSVLQRILAARPSIQADPTYIPKLYSELAEDGSLLFEWILPNFRIGFTIEHEPKESGWFLVSNQELGSILASGYTSDNNPYSMVSWLVSFLVYFS